jgi:sulfite reductase beta subunit-like hemoprotein
MQPLTSLIPHDLAQFEEYTHLFLLRQLDNKTYLPLRTRNGVYTTRDPGMHMVRIKLPAGVLTAPQARAVADVLDDYSTSRRAHITTRQDLQLYHLKLEHTPAVLRTLAVAGLISRYAGGNAVRNVKCCPFGGLHATAPFDPTPYAQALADYFLRFTEDVEVGPGVWRNVGKLPRKFKISFGGCCGDDDCGQANINDLGFLAATHRETDGTLVHGFAIKAGGGLSNAPREALLLKEFIPADELLPWAEAVLRVYMLHGKYEGCGSRRKARLKHLIDNLGWDFFRSEVFRIRETLPRTVPLELERFVEAAPAGAPDVSMAVMSDIADTDPRFTAWLAANVCQQKQDGYVTVSVRAPLHDFTSRHLRDLADAATSFGNGTLRMSDAQAVLLRHVARRNLKPLFAFLTQAGMATASASSLANIASCPGSDTCRIGITSSRDLMEVVEKWVAGIEPTLRRDTTIGPLMIRASGCPSSCGQHHIATIGFHGEARALKVLNADGETETRHVPMAVMYVGGSTNRISVHFARKIAALPVYRVTEALDRVFNLYLDTRFPGQSFLNWAQKVDFMRIHNAVFPLTHLDPTDERLFFDANHGTPFAILPTGGGESGI